ncbi:hypothetical protein K443DRAFT_686611 [Laccaria amethystina LaAM-08-1]|uniref:Uncharacterized protein n=1 Tax=Laccaria amethystina LaAM-08-1 TaxID=1095629 RepID=A0A0C9WLX0_9AGAR|nr:hypothetical protein K443DRAFT_686611 [Laccaria amethystina LaAM-08-1]
MLTSLLCRSFTSNFEAYVAPTQKHNAKQLTHAIVAALNIWSPHGHMPGSASTCPLPLTPSSQPAPTSSTARKLNPTASKVQAGAPDPPEQ